MIRTLNTVNKNMNVLQTKQENTSANVTNVNTPGYKFQRIVQSTLETQTILNHTDGREVSRRRNVGPYVFGNQIDDTYINHNQGTIYQTGIETDYALLGDGFFTVQMDDGNIAYTRNGHFRLNDNNQLVTMEGYLVLDQISSFGNPINLDRVGDTLFTSDNNPNAIEGQVRQGYLESSNVVIVDEMVDMIRISREFEANQKVLHAADETLAKAVNDIGRV